MIMEFNWWMVFSFFLVLLSVLVALHPCGELWHRTRADGFANVRFTHTHTYHTSSICVYDYFLLQLTRYGNSC